MSPIDRARIRVESGCDEQTIKKYPNVRDASKRRIERAAELLGIELPAATPSNPPPSRTEAA
jgi:hypothetical protein